MGMNNKFPVGNPVVWICRGTTKGRSEDTGVPYKMGEVVGSDTMFRPASKIGEFHRAGTKAIYSGYDPVTISQDALKKIELCDDMAQLNRILEPYLDRILRGH